MINQVIVIVVCLIAGAFGHAFITPWVKKQFAKLKAKVPTK